MHLLHRYGYDARLSDSNRPWDIEIYLPTKISRVQVKGGWWTSQGYWRHNLKKNNGVKSKQPYQRCDFDFLAFDGPDCRLYMVPTSAIHDSIRKTGAMPTAISNMHAKYSEYLIHAPN
jgi:3-hydroxy-3-methylglutaryl CoA synthase